MSYPGNTALSQEIQQRILSTFEQTLSMAGEGNRQEAMLGCDFILRLDPKFELARSLQERIQLGDDPIDTSDLVAALAAGETLASETPEEVATAEDLFAEPVAEPDEPAAAEEPPAEVEDVLPVEIQVDESPAQEAPPEQSEGEFWNEDDDAAISLEGEEDEAQSQQRIEDLLAEGQGSFEAGQYQEAIDSWSRIFLLDIDQPEATRRIELARKLKAEVERKVEEVFHEGLSFIEDGSFEQARDSFERVLEISPNHMAAREYLQKLDEDPAELASGATAVPDIRSRMPAPTMGDDLEDENLLPPLSAVDLESGATPAQPAREAPAERVSDTGTQKVGGAVKRQPGKKRTFQLVAAAGLLLVLVAAWFLYSRRQQIFPNSGDDSSPVEQAQVIDPIVRATALFDEGRTALAIAQLRRLPPDHPKQAEAEALIAQWESVEAEDDPEGAAAEMDALEQQGEILARAREAFDSGDNLTASTHLEQAASLVTLDGADLELQQQVAERLAPLKSELELFHQGDWEFALPGLWRIHVDEPLNRDARRLLIDSYINIGIRELQRGDPRTSLASFTEALNLDPDDLELRRLAAFASTYQNREADLLYRIFVKYQPFR